MAFGQVPAQGTLLQPPVYSDDPLPILATDPGLLLEYPESEQKGAATSDTSHESWGTPVTSPTHWVSYEPT